MNQPINLKTTTLASPATAGCGFLLVVLALACLGLLRTAQAQLPSPTPDGGYPNGNTPEGTNALASLTTGTNNTADGFQALFSNATGAGNTADGAGALQNNNADDNTANGANALFSNTIGIQNTANGVEALFNNTTANENTASGYQALFSNTTGIKNTAVGVEALFNNTIANENTANGYQALFSNTTGVCNTAIGFDALHKSTIGGNNTASGWGALELNTTGGNNAANGFEALFSNTTGSNNVALGYLAGHNLTTGSNNIDIGNGGVAGEGAKIRIGKVGTQNGTFIAGIHGVTVASAVGVVIDANGHLGTVTSSARFKDEIKPMDKASEAILALQPVTFRYKHELDPDGIPQFGLVAEQVEKVNPDLVVRDADGKINTVRYEAVNAMLLNEFLKEHRKVEEQQATIAELKSSADNQRAISMKQDAIIAQQQKQIEALTTGLQKVSDRLEVSKAAPQMVADNQ